MPTATAFATQYLDRGGALFPSTQRFRVANAVSDLSFMLRSGMSAANAQAEISRKKRHSEQLWEAARILNSAQIVTDFQAIDTP